MGYDWRSCEWLGGIKDYEDEQKIFDPYWLTKVKVFRKTTGRGNYGTLNLILPFTQPQAMRWTGTKSFGA